MNNNHKRAIPRVSLKLVALPHCAKALFTVLLAVMSLAMAGAAAQVWVHDIIPTFYDTTTETASDTTAHGQTPDSESTVGADPARGDLFADMAPTEPQEMQQIAFYKSEQFVWLLKWSHIHLFGMNMIFILLGLVTVMLDLSDRQRTWLVVLPFIGVTVDIAAMWLKTYLHPVFFWLHIPGGGLFGLLFGLVALRAVYEMWFAGSNSTSSGNR